MPLAVRCGYRLPGVTWGGELLQANGLWATGYGYGYGASRRIFFHAFRNSFRVPL